MAHVARILSSLLFGAMLFTCPLYAQDIVPFSTSNQNPLISIYGLPASSPARILSAGSTEVAMRVDIASSSSLSSADGGEFILLDGETHRYTLALKRGIGRSLELGLEIPYARHREGFLDNFIIDWHDFFNLPQGEREDFPEDRLTYRYDRNGETEVLLDNEEEGIGDLRLTCGWQVINSGGKDPRQLALRASLKLPTGDEDKLLGSGSTDLALWLSGSEGFAGGTVALFGSVGALLMTESDILPDQQRQVVGFGSLGAGWQALKSLDLKLQIDGHSAFYSDSSFRELGESAQLIIGGTLYFGETTAVDIGVSEDIAVDSAPDVTFHVALRTRF